MNSLKAIHRAVFPAMELVLGMSIAQIIATVQVHVSNGRLFAQMTAVAEAGFLPVPNPNIMYLGMTDTFEPFNNLKVRQAIAAGIDRKRIVDNFYPAGSEVASHFTPCSITNGCQGKAWYDFDAAAARKSTVFGVVEATLADGSWSIRFLDVDGQVVDRAAGTCR